MKFAALMIQSGGLASLSPGEVALAAEDDYELKENGEVTIRKAKLKFGPNFRFAFLLLAKANGIDYRLNVSCKEWEAMGRALRVRDRLMHPKLATDLQVTDDETRDALIAYQWTMIEIASLSATALLKILRGRGKMGVQ